MGATEKYPHAPIAMVIAEVRHPPAEPFSSAESLLVKAALGGVAPIGGAVEDVPFVNAETGIGGIQRKTRFTSRDKYLGITFNPDSIVVECTSYQGWEWLRDVIALAIEARQDTAPVDGVERIGLRYVDEVRVPGHDRIEWREWVQGDILGPMRLADSLGRTVPAQQGIIVLSDETTGDIHQVRHAQGVGRAVGEDPLRRPGPPEDRSGPFLLIDIDGSWTAQDEIPIFDRDWILQVADRLHAPIGLIFESLITDRLRDEVLRNAN